MAGGQLQVLPQQDDFGTSFGRSLGSGLQQLMNNQVQHMQERRNYQKKVTGLRSLGFSNAEELANLDDATLQIVIRDRLERSGNTSEFNQGYRPNVDPYESQQEQQFEQPEQQQYSMLEQLAGSQQPMQTGPQHAMNLGGPRLPFNPGAQQAQAGNPFMQQPQFQSAEEQAFNLGNWQRPQQETAEQVSPQLTSQPNAEVKPQSLAETIGPKPKKPDTSGMSNKQKDLALRQYKEDIDQWQEDRKFIQSQKNREEDIAREEKKDFEKKTKELRETIIKEKNDAKSELEKLGELERLETAGNLDTPGYLAMLEELGIDDLETLKDPSTTGYNKIVNHFVKDAKTYFGGRVSNFEVEQFLKTLPNLSASPEGRKLVIANMKRFANLKVATHEAYYDVMKENNWKPVDFLDERIDDRVEKKRDKIAEMFKSDLAKPVPAAQNRAITLLQAGIGKAFSGAGKKASKDIDLASIAKLGSLLL